MLNPIAMKVEEILLKNGIGLLRTLKMVLESKMEHFQEATI